MPVPCEITLNTGVKVLVDAEDYEALSAHKWFFANGYAARTVGNRKAGYSREYMHRRIMMTPSSMSTDHINGNGLDNRRDNLRVCTHRQNLQNQRPQSGKTSKYRGVCFHGRSGKWRAQITVDGKRKWLGQFTDEKEAVMAYQNAAKEHFGEYARAL